MFKKVTGITLSCNCTLTIMSLNGNMQGLNLSLSEYVTSKVQESTPTIQTIMHKLWIFMI